MVRNMLTFFAALTCILSLVSSQLNYRNLYTSSSACTMGRLQSPIDLSDSISSYNSTVNMVYNNYLPLQNAVLNWSADGRILEVKAATPMANFGYMGLTRGGVLKQYALTAIQVNFPSEHSIEGVMAQAEIKLIHDKVMSYQTTVDQYRRIPDANTHLVISLLYSLNANNTDNGLMDQLTSTLTSKMNTFNFTSTQNINLNSYGVVQDRQFYFYEGSYTSAPCDETVNYIVIKDNFYLSSTANSILSDVYSKYVNSLASKPQSILNGRQVFRNYINVGESFTSSSFTRANVLMLIFVLISLIA